MQNSPPEVIDVGERSVLQQDLIKRNGDQRRLWYWYRVANHDTSSENRAKLLQLAGLLAGHEEALVIAVAADYEGSPDRADKLLRDFVMSIDAGLIVSAERNQ